MPIFRKKQLVREKKNSSITIIYRPIGYKTKTSTQIHHIFFHLPLHIHASECAFCDTFFLAKVTQPLAPSDLALVCRHGAFSPVALAFTPLLHHGRGKMASTSPNCCDDLRPLLSNTRLPPQLPACVDCHVSCFGYCPGR